MSKFKYLLFLMFSSEANNSIKKIGDIMAETFEVEYLGENAEYEIVDGKARKQLETKLSDAEYDSNTGILTLKRTLIDGSNGTFKVINLPKELIVSSGLYNTKTKQIELNLAAGKTLYIDVADIISDLTTYTGDESSITSTSENNTVTFSLSNEYKTKIAKAYEVATSGVITSDDLATSTKAGIVSIGDTLTINNGVVNIIPTVTNKVTFTVTNSDNDTVKLNVNTTDISGTTTSSNVELSNEFKYDTKLELSDSVKDILAKAPNKSDVLALSGGTMTGNIVMDQNYIKLSDTARIYAYNDSDSMYFNTNQLYFSNTDNKELKYTFPGKSGTLSLTSDLNDYLPLTGGIMSGDVTFGSAGKLSISGNDLVIESNGSATKLKTTSGTISILGKDGGTYDLSKLTNNTLTNVKWENDNNQGILTFYTNDSDEPYLTVDLPLEKIVSGGHYDSANKLIVIELTDGMTIDIPAEDIVNQNVDDITIKVDSATNQFALTDTYKLYVDNAMTGLTYNTVNDGNTIKFKSTEYYNNRENENRTKTIISLDSNVFSYDSSVSKVSLAKTYAEASELDNYLKKSIAAATYQPIGSYALKSELTNAISNLSYLPLSGGTLTGNLTVNNANITASTIKANSINVLNISNGDTKHNIVFSTELNKSFDITDKYGTFNLKETKTDDVINNVLSVSSKDGISLWHDTNETDAEYNISLRSKLLNLSADAFEYNGSTTIKTNNGLYVNGHKVLDDTYSYIPPFATNSSAGVVYISSTDPVLTLDSSTGLLSTDMSSYLNETAIAEKYQVKGDYLLRSEAAEIFTFKGTVETYADLPTSAENGDIYTIKTAYDIYDAYNNFAWNGAEWVSIGSNVDVSELVTYDYLNTNYLTKDATATSYLSKTEAYATYMTLTDGDKYLLKSEYSLNPATNTTSGIVTIDSAGYANNTSTISVSNGNIYLTADNIKNALGYTPASNAEVPKASATVYGKVIVDNENTNKTISVSNGNIYLTADNIKNALGEKPLTSSDLNSYVTLANDETISGYKHFSAANSGYYNGAETVNVSLSANNTWLRNIYAENIILPFTNGTSNALSFSKISSVSSGVATLNKLISITSDGDLIKTTDGVNDVYATHSYVDTLINQYTAVIETLQNKIESLEQQLAQIQVAKISITDFTLTQTEYLIGSSINSVTSSWSTNITPEEICLYIDDVKYDVDSSLKTTTISDITISGNTTVTLQVSANNTTTTAVQNIKFLNNMYYGTLAAESITDEEIVNLSSELTEDASFDNSIYAATDEYIYFVIPTRLADIEFTISGFAGGFTNLGITTLTNNNKYSEKYTIYRSDYSGLGSVELIVK